MTSHAPLFEETGDDTADQLVLKLTQACEMLMQQNHTLQAKHDDMQAQLSRSRATENETRKKIESLIRRIKMLEQES